MKRVLALLLAMLVCVGMLVACGDTPEEPHVHTYSTTWTSDSSNHWYSATCECTDAPIVKLAHADKNNDGACDVCEYKVACAGGHTYSEDWTVDCTNHWHAADCGHVVAGADVAAHADGDGDGKCDVCAYVINDIHTHYYDSAWTGDGENHWHAALCEHKIEVADKAAHELNAAGYCTVCEAKVVEIDKTSFQAIIDAALASNGKVTGASVLASQISYDGSGADLTVGSALTNDVYFVLGETDTYVFWKSFDAEGNFLGADEYWYEYAGKDASGDDVVFGVGKTFGEYQIVPVAGNMKLLNGYNYVPGGILPSDSDDTSTLANVVSALYAIKTSGTNVSNVVELYDAESGAYTFGFDYFTVNTTEMSDGTVEYQVYYFETVVAFTVDENFVIDNAMILVDSYRNWELDNDLDYDPVQNTVTLKDTANPSRYTYMVAQTSGERTFTTPYPRESLIPQDFELYNGKGDWSDDTPPVLIITDYDKIEETVTFAEDDTVRIFLDDLDPITSSAMFINESDIVITAVNKDAASEGVLFTSTYYSKDYGFIGFSAKNAGSYDVTVKYGDVVKTFVAVVEEPESTIGDLEDNQFVVETTDNNCWVDEYVFVAEDGEGTYVLTLPAGLGLWSKASYDNWGAPEFDALDPELDTTVSHNVEIELEAGDSYTFYVGATTRGEWVITYAYVASDVEGGDGDAPSQGGGSSAASDLVVGNNAFVFSEDEITAGYAERALTITEDGNYKFAGDVLISSVTSSEGVPAVYENYAYALTAGEYTVRITVFYNQAGVSYRLEISNENAAGGEGGEGGGDVNPSLPVLNLGENTVVLEESDLADGKDYSFVAAEEGTYTVSGDLLAIFLDSEGMQLGRGQVSLAPGTYTVKFVNIMNAAGEFTVNVTYTAPSTGDGEGTEGDPYVWTELPESVSFNSDTINKVYYLFTATESGNITFTWPTADSWATWFEMDGNNTTANSGGSNKLTAMEVSVEAGKTYRFDLGTYDVPGDVTITIAFGAGSQGGEGGEGGEGGDEIVIKQNIEEGENTIDVTADDITSGKIYVSFMAFYSGEHEFYSGDFLVDSVKDTNGNTIESNDYGYYELVEYESYVIELSTRYISFAGECTLNAKYNYPEGHQNNPFWIYSLDENVVASYDGFNVVWYQFYAPATGTLTVTEVSGLDKAVLMITRVFGKEISSTSEDDDFNIVYGDSVSLAVTANTVYYIGVYTDDYGVPAEIEFTASVEEGEIETDGTANVPHNIAIGDNTASIIDGEAVYYVYTFTGNGTLTLTTENANVLWFLTAGSSEIDATSETTISINGFMDDKVYLYISTADFSTADIAFTASVELDPTELYFESELIVDGSAANELVLVDNSFMGLNFYGRGEFVISWDNADAIVEIVDWNMPNTPVVNGGVIAAGNFGTYLRIYLPEYAAGTVNLTIAPYVAGGELEDNQFVVETTDTNCWVDEYVFVAEDGEGTYVLTLPAGLGLWSKASYDNWGAPEFDALDPELDTTVSHNVEIELEAGDSYTFYVGATTRGEWVITYAYVASDVEGGDGDAPSQGGGSSAASDLVVGNNAFVFSEDEITAGYAERALTITEDGNYKFAGDVLISSVTSSEGVPAVYENYAYALTAGEYTVRITVFYNQAGVSYRLEISNENAAGGEGGEGGGDVNPSLPVLNLGENTVVLEESDLADGKDYSFVAAEEGTYTVSGDLLAIFLDSEGMQLGRGQVSLAPGTYTVKFVNIMNAAGEFTVNVTYTAPSTGDGEGTEGDPYVWTELPESVSFNSDTINKVYYLFTATESGNITFTWPTADSWATWFEMDGNNTTANSGGSNKLTAMEVSVEAGKTYRFDLGTYDVPGDVTITIAFGAGSQGGEGGEGGEGGDEIVIKQNIEEGENTIDVTADDITSGKIYVSFMAFYSGEHEFYSGDFLVDSVKDTNGNTIESNDYGYYELVEYESYVIELSTRYISFAGECTLNAKYNYPEGHQNNPFWIYSLDENVVASYDGFNVVWYQFYAPATGTLTVTEVSGLDKAVLMITRVFGKEISSTSEDDDFNIVYGDSVSLAVTANTVYYIGVYTDDYGVPAEIEFTASVEEGEIETDGTANVPHNIAIGDNTASIIDGEAVYYVYTFTGNGTLTLTTENANVLWFLTAGSSEIDATSETTISINGFMDDKVYLYISTADFSTADIAFTASVELDPTELYFESELIVDGSAANELVLVDNSFMGLNFYGRGEFVISWDNADAIVEIVDWNMPNTPVVNGGVIAAGNFGTYLRIYLPEYAAGTVNLTIAPATGGSEESGDYDLEVGDNTVSVTDTWEGNEVTFTATEAGRYTFVAGANCVLIYDYSNYFEGDSFYVDLEAGASLTFVVATEDRTASDVTVTVSQSAIGEAVIPSSISGDFKYTDPASWKHRWLITVNTDGTGTIKEENYDSASFNWGSATEDTFTYTYADGIITIDFASGAIAADGTYTANAEAISGIEIGGAAVTFEIVT